MLSVTENERLTRVSPGTPMGELLRRYWWPIATDQELEENPVKAVRILGESLTLFRDRQGRPGLVAQRCAHRKVDLRYGIPEPEGLRCPYHGWMYDTTGQCIDQPAESPDSVFKNKVKIPAYPVEEMGGLLWAYLGAQPAPLLPRWSLFVYENVFRQIGTTIVPCNWLQCQENSVDTVHTEWLHGRFGEYVLERTNVTDPVAWNQIKNFRRHHTKVGFELREYGIQKFRLRDGEDESDHGWTVGHPLVFPNMVLIGGLGRRELQIRVPMDDTHTWHLAYQVYFPTDGVQLPPQYPVPTFDVPITELPDYVLGQDVLAWPAQDEIVDRSTERLAETDRGLIMFRKQLAEQIKAVENGADPINVFWDPAKNQCIELPMEEYPELRQNSRDGTRFGRGPNSPIEKALPVLMGQA